MSEQKEATLTDEELSPPTKKQRLEETSGQDGDLSKEADVDEAPSSVPLDSDKYTDHVTADDVDRLREFHVLDEVTNEDSDNDSSDSDKSEGVPEEEIERMLEENLPDELKGAPKPKERPFITRQKVVLEEKGVNPFEVLPLDWVMVRHYSGIPVYIHRTTRVCTLAKPYFLGTGNTRRHDIPISAIPCLSYRRALEEGEKQKEIDKEIEEQIKSGTWKKTYDDKLKSNNVVNTSVTKDNAVKQSENNENPVNKSKSNDNNVDKFENNDNLTNGISIQNNDIDSTFMDQCKKIQNEIDSDKDIPKCPFKHNIEIKIEKNKSDLSNDEHDKPVSVKFDDSDAKSLKTNKMESEETEAHKNKNCDETETMNEETEAHKNKNCDETETMKENGEAEQNGETQNQDSATVKEKPLNRQPVVLPGGEVMPPPRVETVSTSWKSQHLSPDQVTEYCKALFRFKRVNIMHFKRWADRRKYTKARKALQYPALPEGTKLITIPAQPAQPGHENGGRAQRDWVMNMNGRSYLSVFHEYVRRALQKQPVYQFKSLENAAQPYQATVFIGDMQYGVGRGASKRAAKAAAARASIHILIPEMAQMNDEAPAGSEPDFSYFDYVGIEDPRIMEFCASTCEPSPHAILRTCLLRNFGATDRHIHTEMKKMEYQKIELTMKVGKHTATVVCKNKKSAKQRASQAILQALHPHVRSWGSLLRLYGSRSVKSGKEKKLEEQQITLLQDSARHNEPNYAVLEKLRNEMRKLRERDEAVVPIGTLLVKDDLPTHSGSNLNNVEL